MRPGADLFAGLGGFTEGARGLLDIRLAVNHSELAVTWHQANHTSTEHACQDLMHYDWRELPRMREAGFLLASPACQGFTECSQPARKGTGGNHEPSSAAILAKHQADRNTTWGVLAACDTARPHTVIVENVLPLLRWALLPAWTACLEAMGYQVRVHTINAARYGSCQDRDRVIITARQGSAVELAPDYGQASPVGEALDLALPYQARGIDHKPERMRWRMRKAQDQAGALCLWNNVSESAGRPLEGLAPTLTTKAGSQLYLLDGDRCRTITPRELARIQGFPDTYKLPAHRGEASLLIGNAIDVNVARGAITQCLAS